MTELILAFITGFTTGGLSCLAVQGGLLASSMAQKIEQDINGKQNHPHVAKPILWFLVAKLAAYTLLGFFLGWIGSLIQLTPLLRAIFQIAIGIFMLGQALRLFNVHPIFRYFNIETPHFIRKYIRTRSKQGNSNFTPAFLGALTVFIPCGITQAMMASAIATGNPMMGAALMFAFILGTSPIFFVVAYFATRLGARLEKYFMKLVAVVVMVLALLTIQTGLNLLGWPVFFTNMANQKIVSSGAKGSIDGYSPPIIATARAIKTPETVNIFLSGTQIAQNPSENTSDEVNIKVINTGYQPKMVEVAAGKPIHLTLSSDEVYSCALSFVIPSQNVEIMLQPSDSQSVDLPAMQPGEKLPFSCSMGMYTGVIVAR